MSNPVNPGKKRRAPPETAEFFVGSYERLLGDIMGVVEVLDYSHRQAEDARVIPTDNLAKSGLIPSLGRNNEFDVADGVGIVGPGCCSRLNLDPGHGSLTIAGWQTFKRGLG